MEKSFNNWSTIISEVKESLPVIHSEVRIVKAKSSLVQFLSNFFPVGGFGQISYGHRFHHFLPFISIVYMLLSQSIFSSVPFVLVFFPCLFWSSPFSVTQQFKFNRTFSSLQNMDTPPHTARFCHVI